jgi:hypothetical protein
MRLERAWLLLPVLLVPAALQFAPLRLSSTPEVVMSTPHSPISVKLDVGIDGRNVPMTVQFSNTSSEKAYLYVPNACAEGKIQKNLFKVEGKPGQSPVAEVAYKGPYRKLASPTPRDFIELAPGASSTTHVDLAAAYDFPAGPGHYEVYYSAINPSPQPGQLKEMRSNRVAFELQ